MIRSIKHKGLARFHASGNHKGIQPAHAKRLRMQLAALETASVIGDLDLPGYHLHPLKGRAAKRWSIRVSGNWRLTFEFDAGDVHLLDYEDYH